MPKLSEKTLTKRDAQRDISQELLMAVRELKAGHWARKTTFEAQRNGQVLRRVVRADGAVEKEELLPGTTRN